MRDAVQILEIPVDNISMPAALNKVLSIIADPESKPHLVCTPNAEIMWLAHNNPKFKKVLCEADMVIPDGVGVVLASRILRHPLNERVAGIDLVKNILTADFERKIKVFLFGSKPGVAEEAAQNIEKEHPNVEVVGFAHGYFDSSQEQEIIEKINQSQADLLLVGLGAPKQELWIDSNKTKLNVKVCIGVGGVLNILAGRLERAPMFFQKHGLEWFYRLCKEPSRFFRILTLPRFIFAVIFSRCQRGG